MHQVITVINLCGTLMVKTRHKEYLQEYYSGKKPTIKWKKQDPQSCPSTPPEGYNWIASSRLSQLSPRFLHVQTNKTSPWHFFFLSVFERHHTKFLSFFPAPDRI